MTHRFVAAEVDYAAADVADVAAEVVVPDLLQADRILAAAEVGIHQVENSWVGSFRRQVVQEGREAGRHIVAAAAAVVVVVPPQEGGIGRSPEQGAVGTLGL
jgi:hypothetical protein